MFSKDNFRVLSLICCLLLSGHSLLKASGNPDLRADSFDIKHYSIQLDMRDLTSQTLNGNCSISVQSKMNGLHSMSLEFYKMQVDSILLGGKRISYFYDGTIIGMPLGKNYQAGDTFSCRVFYHGKPFVDPSGFGGFLFSTADDGYAFNLGVGFDAQPHNLSRTWFPCVDNFTDRATFSFYIRTQKNIKAFCNGLLQDSTASNGNEWLWHWEMRQNIPAYLASVTAGNYYTLKYKVNSQSGPLEVEMGIVQSDLEASKISFQHLPQIVKIFEDAYGPYLWDRIGYVSVPFGLGAMEHASNITLPRSVVQSGLSNETLWAHELSHHWCGDLATCRNAEEMWLNEGWASYSESLVTEKLYGDAAYITYARQNHYRAIRYGWVKDKGWRALSPMDENYTYGTTIYNKGADVVHSLRTYLGDTLFFQGVKDYFASNRYKDVSTEDLKTSLERTTGKDLSYFFTAWVYSPGYPHLDLLPGKIAAEGSGYKISDLVVYERRLYAPALYKDMPFEITFMDNQWRKYVYKGLISDSADISLTLPFRPDFTAINMDGKITDAVTREYKTIEKPGTYDFTESLMSVKVDQIRDSALLYVEHHWIGAVRTPNTPWNIRLSDERYWTVDGLLPDGFSATATVVYDGRELSTPEYGGYLDNKLLSKNPEDSLLLMYRASPWDEWMEYPDYVKTMGSHTDKSGSIKINGLKKGQYTLAMRDKTASLPEGTEKENSAFSIYPNPADHRLCLSSAQPMGQFIVYDIQGKNVYQADQLNAATEFSLDTSRFATGLYIVKMRSSKGEELSRKVLISHP
jgi:aminopeptidase N